MAKDPYLYCHECKRWVATVDDDHDGYECADCGETILCDECGQPWTFGLEHEHAIAKQKARTWAMESFSDAELAAMGRARGHDTRLLTAEVERLREEVARLREHLAAAGEMAREEFVRAERSESKLERKTDDIVTLMGELAKRDAEIARLTAELADAKAEHNRTSARNCQHCGRRVVRDDDDGHWLHVSTGSQFCEFSDPPTIEAKPT
jgi:DNA-directed RNA polymerase subunit RPC12/RpoP